MAKSPLFSNWTWKLSMPEPFDKISSNVSTAHYSSYCTVATKKATLHAPLLPPHEDAPYGNGFLWVKVVTE